MKKKIFIKKEDAISFFDGASDLAKKLGIAKQAVSQWPEYIPEQSAWPVYYLSNGKIKAVISFPETQKPH